MILWKKIIKYTHGQNHILDALYSSSYGKKETDKSFSAGAARNGFGSLNFDLLNLNFIFGRFII